MRCDTQIYFVTDGAQELVTDPNSEAYGSYVTGKPKEVDRMADVTDTQTSTQQLVYGKLQEASRTVRLNGQYLEPFDHIRIGSVLYDVDAKRHLRHRSVFICHDICHERR